MKGFEAMVVKATARTGHAKTESTESPNRFILVKDKLVALFYSNKLNFHRMHYYAVTADQPTIRRRKFNPNDRACVVIVFYRITS